MAAHSTFRILLVLLLAQAACVAVYSPSDAPVTEESLSQAIETLQSIGENVAVLEDGFQLEAYTYEWERMPLMTDREIRDTEMTGFPGDHKIRVIRGPSSGVYVPFASIRSVAARSWPSWSAVELSVVGPEGQTTESPVVIRARDDEEARQLADAIEYVRRARVPAAPESDELEAGEPDAGEAETSD